MANGFNKRNTNPITGGRNNYIGQGLPNLNLGMPNIGNASDFSNFTNQTFGGIRSPKLPAFGSELGSQINLDEVVVTGKKAASGLSSALSGIAGDDPGAFGQVAQGLAGIAGGLIGGGARRREQREARRELAEQREAYEQFQFQDPTANMTNPFEDLTVNQQQAQFQAQQNQQALASTLSGLQGSAGGSGIGALAQAIAQQQQQGMQQAAASIGMQESRNQILRARGQQALEAARSRGAQYVQDREFGRTEDLFSIAAARKVAADEARRQATQNLVGGIGNLAVGGVRAAISGGIL